MSGFRSGLITTKNPQAADRRNRAASEALYARSPVETAPPMTSFDPMLVTNYPLYPGTADTLYIKRLTPCRDNSGIMNVRAWVGTTASGDKTAVGIYRIDAVPGTSDTFTEGRLVPRLSRVWSYVNTTGNTEQTIYITPHGVHVGAHESVDNRVGVRLSPEYDYAVGIAYSVVPVGTAQVSTSGFGTSIAIDTGWTDLPAVVTYEDTIKASSASWFQPYFVEIFMNSSLSVSFY